MNWVTNLEKQFFKDGNVKMVTGIRHIEMALLTCQKSNRIRAIWGPIFIRLA